MKQIATKRLALLIILLSTVFFWYVYAADTTSDTFVTQSSTWLGSSNSVISTEFYARPSGSGAYYINKGNNSSIIGNYFEGYYYDSMLWYFEFDWSTNPNENIRIVGSTSLCPDWYWYKLGGYSYSSSFWYIDFDYNDDTFVYYCEDEGALRWYAYNSFSWFQNFAWIAFDIWSTSNIVITPPEWDDTFVNSPTNISNDSTAWDTTAGNAIDPGLSEKNNSNFTRNTIQNYRFEFDVRVESSFYIIK
jgi:hypothetical protein